MTARTSVRLAPEARRQSILEHARDVLWSKGLLDFTVREIASAAGVSVGTVTHHFATSTEIIEGVLGTESERLRDRVNQAVELRRSTMDGVDQLIDVALADDPSLRQFWTIWLAAGARSAHDETLARFFAERYRTWRDVLRALIDEGSATGELVVTDPAMATTALVALIDGYGLQSFFEEPASAAAARTAVRRIARQLLVPG